VNPPEDSPANGALLPAPSNEAALPLPFLASRDEAHTASGSPVEQEVTELFGLLRKPVLRYLLTFGLRVEEGEEVVQEVFLALFRQLHGGARLGTEHSYLRANLRGWIFRVAHNLALKQRMANRRRWTQAGTDDLENHSDGALDPEQQSALSESLRRLRAVLAALPETDQRCLALRAEGLRYREIAEILGISLGAVSVSLARSLGRFERVNGGL
jgi:RNA polymerase sigma-70 factor, ECF subfamily